MSLRSTASQTAGPFFAIGMRWAYGLAIAGPDAPGERVAVGGRVIDGDGRAVADAVLEIWQADAAGRYGADAAAGFRGFGRVPTDAEGRFRVDTIRPGRAGDQAPHLAVSLVARGLLRRLATRMYFPGDPANDADPVLACVPAARRATLVARPGAGGVLAWDIVLQGAGETVFFDV
jgi:protocatechuate 3,4-dioxygenase alpha subunit